jgi:hypothetical protein
VHHGREHGQLRVRFRHLDVGMSGMRLGPSTTGCTTLPCRSSAIGCAHQLATSAVGATTTSVTGHPARQLAGLLQPAGRELPVGEPDAQIGEGAGRHRSPEAVGQE